MTTFTVRITEENGNPVAWIDRDNQICIMQPHSPDQPVDSIWESKEAALNWANAHATELENFENESIAANVALEQAKASARGKLVALGLTNEEISALTK
jgi:hypothetical protein